MRATDATPSNRRPIASIALRVSLGVTMLGAWSLAAPRLTAAGAAETCPVATASIHVPISDGIVYTVPTSIDSTGSREVSTELQSWLAGTVQSGTPDHPSVVRFQPGGRYWVDYTLILRKQSGGIPAAVWPTLAKFSRDNVRIDLNGATLEQRTNQPYKRGATILDPRKKWGDPILFTGGATGVEITNGTISGVLPTANTQPALEEWAGIKISGRRSDDLPVQSIWVHNIAIRHVFGDFIYMSAGTSKGEHLDGVLIEDNQMTVSGRQGIVLNGGTNVVIRHNDIRNVARITFDSEPTAAQGWQNVTISENTGNAGPFGYFVFQAPRRSTAENLHILGNTIIKGNFRVRVAGGKLEPRRCIEFSDNRNLGTDQYTISLQYRHLVRIAYWDLVTIRRNLDRILPTEHVAAVDLEGSTNTSVAQNRWVGALDDQCLVEACPAP